MNPLFEAARETMTPGAGVLMGVMTLLFMAIFLGWFAYAYAPSRREQMAAFGEIPFDEDDHGA